MPTAIDKLFDDFMKFSKVHGHKPKYIYLGEVDYNQLELEYHKIWWDEYYPGNILLFRGVEIIKVNKVSHYHIAGE